MAEASPHARCLACAFPFWEQLTPEEQERLCRFTRSVHYAKGARVHSPLESCVGILLLRSGQLRSYLLSEDGRDVTLYRLFGGEVCILSASCVMDAVNIDLYIDAEEDTEALCISAGIFRQLMQEQKQRAREARKALGDLGWAGVEFGKDIPATEFVGYDHDELDATVVALVAEDELRGEIPAGSDAVVVLDKSPFYAEMGGQVADHGTITGGGTFQVRDVQKNKGGKFMHYGQLTEGALHVGDINDTDSEVSRLLRDTPAEFIHTLRDFGNAPSVRYILRSAKWQDVLPQDCKTTKRGRI